MLAELPDDLKLNVVFANGPTHPELGAKVAELLGIELIPIEFKRFPNTETYVRYKEPLRGKHLLAFNTNAPIDGFSTADSFNWLLQMIDAGSRRGPARTITAVVPNFMGARQDRQSEPREALSADLNMKQIQYAGASQFVTVDIHNSLTLNAFDKPGAAEQLTAQPLLRAKLGELIVGDPDNFVLVSPDEGHKKYLRKHAKALGIRLEAMVKDRDTRTGRISHEGRVYGVEGLTCLIMDDIIGTGGTTVSAIENVHDSGAATIYVAATHGEFSNDAAQRLKRSEAKGIYVTDTIPISKKIRDTLGKKLEVLSAAGVIAEGLNQILTEGSVSRLSNGETYS